MIRVSSLVKPPTCPPSKGNSNTPPPVFLKTNGSIAGVLRVDYLINFTIHSILIGCKKYIVITALCYSTSSYTLWDTAFCQFPKLAYPPLSSSPR